MTEDDELRLIGELMTAPDCACPWCVIAHIQLLSGELIDATNRAKQGLPSLSPHDNKGVRSGVLKTETGLAMLDVREKAHLVCDLVTHALWVWGQMTKRGLGPDTN